MVGLEDEAITKRLQKVNMSTDTISTTSLWIIHHHKESIDGIVRNWIRLFKAGSDDYRVAMFYVLNDVVQNAVRKKAAPAVAAFQPAILEAIHAAREAPSVYKAMSRCVSLFGERKVYAQAAVDQMKSALDPQTASDVVDMEPSDMLRKVEGLMKALPAIEETKKLLHNTDNHFTQHIQHKMKDRRSGEAFKQEADAWERQQAKSIRALKRLRDALRSVKHQTTLAHTAFAQQLHEVTIVEDAYQKYHQGMRDVLVELEAMRRTGAYPGASPPRDAPSPTPQDDIYQNGVEGVLNAFRNTGNRDIVEATDMEMDDEEDAPLPAPPPAPMLNVPPNLAELMQHVRANPAPPTLQSPIGMPPLNIPPPNMLLPPPANVTVAPPTHAPPPMPTLPPGMSLPPPVLPGLPPPSQWMFAQPPPAQAPQAQPVAINDDLEAKIQLQLEMAKTLKSAPPPMQGGGGGSGSVGGGGWSVPPPRVPNHFSPGEGGGQRNEFGGRDDQQHQQQQFGGGGYRGGGGRGFERGRGGGGRGGGGGGRYNNNRGGRGGGGAFRGGYNDRRY